jgi:RNA-directed DNA polymerase
VKLRRATHLIITGATKDVLEQVRGEVEAFLAERGLTLSPEKTKIVHVADGFDFLGFNVRTYDGKLLIKPSKDAQLRMHRKVRDIIRGRKAVEQRDLIVELNPIITGWANYYRHVVSGHAFTRLDAILWQALWRWAKRRHPNKGRRWIVKRYFHSIDSRNWVFACESDADHPKDEWKWLRLNKAEDTKIRRHIKVKADANPYDPEWRSYFAGRRAVVAGSNKDL